MRRRVAGFVSAMMLIVCIWGLRGMAVELSAGCLVWAIHVCRAAKFGADNASADV